MYCFLLHLHSVIYVSLVVLFLLCWLKVYYVLPWLMYGQESTGGGGEGITLGNVFGWGCAAGTLELLNP